MDLLERKVYRQIADRKRLRTRQGLLVTGARQVGKTTLIRRFGEDHYRHVAEINFIETPRAVETVTKATDTNDLLLRLSVLAGVQITPGETLLFLDEIQACEDMLTWLKFLAAAQELFAQGFGLHYYNQRNVGEVDLLIQHGMDDVSLVEIKSGKDYTRHRAMDNLLSRANYDFAHAYVFHDGNVETRTDGRGRIIDYLPIYAIGYLRPDRG